MAAFWVFWWWFSHFWGMDNGSGPNYLWWSGGGSDIGEYVVATAFVGGLVAFVRRHNCHVHRCWRMQWKTVPGTDHVVCRKHHAEATGTPPPTIHHVRHAWLHGLNGHAHKEVKT